MLNRLATALARPLSIHRSLQALANTSSHVLIVSPSTRGAIAFAQTLARLRKCVVTKGPITEDAVWPYEETLRSGAEISQAFSGQPVLPRTVISFPDQHPCVTSTSVMVPFLGQRYAFSTLEALLVMRHRPPVFGLTKTHRRWGFRLLEVQYAASFDVDGRLISLGDLMGRLLRTLAADLATPPADWLAHHYLAQKSERMLWMHAREEMKDIECLLRMQLQTRFCDRERTRAALAAVLERQKALTGTSLP